MTGRQYRFHLKLDDGRIVSWVGADAFDAARRYVDAHPEATVVATRTPPVDIVVGPTIEG